MQSRRINSEAAKTLYGIDRVSPQRVVVVTGASGGIGRASAIAFALRGDAVALLARGEAGLMATTAEIEEAGGTAIWIPTDVSDPDAVEAAATIVEEKLGPIDVWVNAAFASIFAPLAEITAAEFAHATQVSYLGYVYGTMAALRRMKSRDRGTIVQVGGRSPIEEFRSSPRIAGQNMPSKASTSPCVVLHDHSGIQTTMVQMPAVNTTQFSWVMSRLPNQAQPVPPIYQPEVAARGVLRAADHQGRREYWVGASTAATLIVNAVVPGILDRVLARTGYTSEQTREHRSPNQPVNLWQPADLYEDFGSHGIFNSRSISRSPQLWASHHHRALTVMTILAIVGVVAKRKGGR